MKILRVSFDVERSHFVEMDGPVIKIGLNAWNRVEFWFMSGAEAEPRKREFTVVGTGHWFSPDDWEYVGTAERHPETGLVWHLLERKQ